jgi:aconitate decarboxylase
MDAIAAFCRHVSAVGYDELPPEAVAAAKTFILDTFGVGIAGSSGPRAGEIALAQELSGSGTDARVWSTGRRLPAPAAALCNAYQVHNSEFDCVHEAAVAHVLSAVLPVAMAGAERPSHRDGKPVDGRRLITAVVLGVDVAASLGVAAKSSLRFFRPATVGAFGATAALGKLMGFDAIRLREAFSITYGQLCGTMQAHAEGSMLLALQMGFSARNAVVSCDLAAAGVEGPHAILEGPFGYFRLFETAGEPAIVADELGAIWRITEVAHKPFPSGRATHGLIDACLELQRTHAIAPDAIASIAAEVPPLVHHLVGRAPQTAMTINYARLCAAYVCARALFRGDVGIEDFCDAAYRDPATQALARRTTIAVRDAGDPNALTPIQVEMTLKDGRRHVIAVDVVYGNPKRPMTREAHLAKFRRNCALGARPIREAKAARLIEAVDGLERLADVAGLVDHMVG